MEEILGWDVPKSIRIFEQSGLYNQPILLKLYLFSFICMDIIFYLLMTILNIFKYFYKILILVQIIFISHIFGTYVVNLVYQKGI